MSASHAETTDIEADTETETVSSGTEDPKRGDPPPAVMIDDVLYEDTGYISSAIGCGMMDGEITSFVDRSSLPTENDQSNFGSGYGYQRSSEGQMIVVTDDHWRIFRSSDHFFDTDMPEQVLNFSAKVKEVRNGALLVEYVDAPDIFICPVTGECLVTVNPNNLKEDVAMGDTVRVWFDGMVQEIYPPILPGVYRIEKEE